MGETKSIYLEECDVRAVERRAKEAGRSFSWVVRDLIRKGVALEKNGEDRHGRADR